MDISHILDSLNQNQRDAVTADNGHLLVLAGAGSGKTRVLVHRIAWYIETEVASPYNILAVTFTNKAASEMRGRIETLLTQSVQGMWVGTFHSLSHRLLRHHWQAAKLPENFQIIDSDDQYRTIRRQIRSMMIDESQYPPRQVQWFINARKDEGLRPEHIDDHDDPITAQMVQIYKTYQENCERAGLVDFAELLLRVFELFRDHQSIRDHYQQRFKHVLVDEFQDTNSLQYAWLRLLVGKHNTLFAVGDDDQAVYSWRGAKVGNMQAFRKDFHNTTLIKLEQNYRSTATILKAANKLIENNNTRLGKELWTDSETGERINVYMAYNEIDEARYVVDQIKTGNSNNQALADYAILYRTSAQSRVLEETLMQARIAYRVYGGMRFYERAEIKDAMAYVRLAHFQDDDAAFERIINTPARSIGNRTVAELRTIARRDNCSLWQAMQLVIAEQLLNARAQNALTQFIELIGQMRQTESALALDKQFKQTIELSGLIDHFKKEKGERGLTRIENLEELIAAAGEFEISDEEELAEMDILSAFIAHSSLESGESQAGDSSDCVHLMTLHSAKGLEFNEVTVVGMEEGLFPHQRSMDDLVQLEEERRLCYVGITRAQKRLTLTYTQHRRLHGANYYPLPSRFIEELPPTLLNDVRLKGSIRQDFFASQRTTPASLNTNRLSLGQRVLHHQFGEGVILNLEGSHQQTRIQVQFEQAGTKWLMGQWADLKML